MHSHPKKFICIETIKGRLYNSAVWAEEKEVMQTDSKKPVLLYQVKTFANSGKVLRTRPIGYVHAGILKDRLLHQIYYSPEFSPDAERILLKKITKDNETVALYVLPVEDQGNQPIGGFLFCKITQNNYSLSHFIGSVSLKDYIILKEKGLSAEKEERIQNFTASVFPLAPLTTFPLSDVHFVSRQNNKEKNISCNMSLQVKNKTKLWFEQMTAVKALVRE